MKRKNGKIVFGAYFSICCAMLLTSCASAAANTVETVVYEANMTASQLNDKEELALRAQEIRLEDAINQLAPSASVTVKISDGQVAVLIQTGENESVTEEQQLQIKELVKRSISGLSEEEIELEICA